MQFRRELKVPRRLSGKCGAILVAIAALLQFHPTPCSAQDTVRITLREAVARAAGMNVDLVRAENALRSALARIELARGAYQPTLSLSVNPSARYQLGTTRELGGTQKRASGSLSLGISSNYTLYNGGADRASLLQAEILARASDVGTNRTSQDVVFSIISSYYDIATERELILVERENLGAERGQLDRVQAFTDAETRPISDLYSQQATVASAELRVLEAQRRLELAKLQLVDVLQLDPTLTYDFPPPDPAELPDTSVAGNTTVLERALAGRPEIAAQQARIDAAEQAIRIADASDAVSMSLGTSLGTSYSTLNEVDPFGTQLITQNPSVGLGLSISIPLYDRNREKVAVEQARIDYENETLAMSALRHQVAIQVRQATVELNIAQARVDAADRQLTSARLAVEVEEARYTAGISTLFERAQARARLVSAEGQLVQARNALALQRQALAYAVGAFPMPRPGR